VFECQYTLPVITLWAVLSAQTTAACHAAHAVSVLTINSTGTCAWLEMEGDACAIECLLWAGINCTG